MPTGIHKQARKGLIMTTISWSVANAGAGTEGEATVDNRHDRDALIDMLVRAGAVQVWATEDEGASEIVWG